MDPGALPTERRRQTPGAGLGAQDDRPACRYRSVDRHPDGGGDHERRTFPAEATGDRSLADEEEAERARRDRGTRQLSPLVLAYVVGPLALGVLLVFRHFGLVARLPIWAYLAAIGGAGRPPMVVEPWHSAPGRLAQAPCPAGHPRGWR